MLICLPWFLSRAHTPVLLSVNKDHSTCYWDTNPGIRDFNFGITQWDHSLLPFGERNQSHLMDILIVFANRCLPFHTNGNDVYERLVHPMLMYCSPDLIWKYTVFCHDSCTKCHHSCLLRKEQHQLAMHSLRGLIKNHEAHELWQQVSVEWLYSVEFNPGIADIYPDHSHKLRRYFTTGFHPFDRFDGHFCLVFFAMSFTRICHCIAPLRHFHSFLS